MNSTRPLSPVLRMPRPARLPAAAALALAFALALAPGLARGAVRFASPQGIETGTCATPATACALERAVDAADAPLSGGIAEPGDEIVVLPGSYTVSGALRPPTRANIHGAAGQRRPVIAAEDRLLDLGGGRIADIDLRSRGGSAALVAFGDPLPQGGQARAVVERVSIDSTVDRQTALELIPGDISGATEVLVRDTTVRTTGTEAVALGVEGRAELRNVTAFASGGGSRGVVALGSTGVVRDEGCFAGLVTSLVIRNAIAHGEAADIATAAARECGPAVSRFSIDHSNFRASAVSAALGPIDTSGPGNQTGPAQTDPAALFVDAAGGNLRQPPSAPTVDAGATDELVGPTDIEGAARPQGAAVDIGPFESARALPSNEFRIARVKRNKRRGTASLFVEVPGTGELALAKTGKVRRAGSAPATAGIAKLRVAARGKGRRKLRRSGKLRAKLALTYAPAGGVPNTKVEAVKLIRRGGR